MPEPLAAEQLVDDAIAQLDGLDTLPVSEHVDVFDTVHRSLQDALAALDEG